MDAAHMDDEERTAAAHEVFGLMVRFVHRTSTDAKAALAAHELNPAQFQLLLAIRRRPGSLQRELSEHFDVTGGNVSMLLAKLEERGLVRRTARGAANTVHLTQAGEAVVGRLLPEQDAFMRARFDQLQDGDLDRLLGLLRRATRP